MDQLLSELSECIHQKLSSPSGIKGVDCELNSSPLPFVTVTYAQTVDGSISSLRGSPTSISCNESFMMTHKIRAIHDGILVGVDTILSDNPSLTVRLCEGPSPIPIVIDPDLRLDLESKVVRSEKLILVTSTKSYYDPSNSHKLSHFVDKKIKIVVVDAVGTLYGEIGTKHHLQFVQIFQKLYSLDIKSVMVEGGASILNSIYSQNDLHFKTCGCLLINSIIVTISPKILLNGLSIGKALSTILITPKVSKWVPIGSDIIFYSYL